MSNFVVKLGNATEILATGEGDVKNRLMLAVTNELIFANVPDAQSIPRYFRDKKAQIVRELKTRTWGHGIEGDLVRATIHPMRFKTAASFARRIWQLYNEFEEYKRSRFIPQDG